MQEGSARISTGNAPVANWGRRVLVLSEGENPSLAFFVRPLLLANGLECHLADLHAPLPTDANGWDAAVVIRYLPSRWEKPLAALRRAGKPVAYFMDDDLMDRGAQAGLPLRYRLKIERYACLRRSAIESLCNDFWVSTPYLAEKYRAWNPSVLPAYAPLAETAVSICYHGTASHAAEQEWLHALVQQLQARSQCTQFSIVGDARLNRRFRSIPRVSVLHPMSWPAYLAHTSAYPCDIALAPLLPGAFNAARGATKILDFVRMGAAGIFADTAPYNAVIRHNVDGLLLPMQHDAWLENILALVDDVPRRQRLAEAAAARVAAGEMR